MVSYLDLFLECCRVLFVAQLRIAALYIPDYGADRTCV